jgi:hypothetical protein
MTVDGMVEGLKVAIDMNRHGRQAFSEESKHETIWDLWIPVRPLLGNGSVKKLPQCLISNQR